MAKEHLKQAGRGDQADYHVLILGQAK